MTHDPLCLRDPDDPDHSPCQCHTIARVRADERERFSDIPDTFRLLAVSTVHQVTRAAYLFAADLVASRVAEENTDD